MGRYRVTVDTGGTFSDFVYFDEESKKLSITKIPSTPHDPSEAIMNGIRHLLNQDIQPEDIKYFCHGTTVGTNALLEEKGAKTGLIVTKGFRGIYEVAEQARPYGAAIFNVMYDKPSILIPQSRTIEAEERVDAYGRVILPLNEEALRETLREFKQEGIESMAVCLLFSFLYPQHEMRVKEIIQEELQNCSISVSAEVFSQIREYYRLSTTVINAYLHPILKRYISSLDKKLKEAGLETRQKYIMQSNGGTSTFQTVAEKAVTTILSGPAGGIIAGVQLSKDTGYQNLITFDMGGTSCDVSLIKNGQSSYVNRGKVDGRDIAMPMMDINTVSAGGGTIARVDHMGVLQVGPDSAGAVPGPACYQKGGELPTITDANLILGYLCEKNFLGGRMTLNKNSAAKAINKYVAQHLEMPVETAAEGIVNIINVKMEEAIKAISTMRGYDLRDFMLVAFGGAGPLHAGKIVQDLNMKGVIVPLYPGVNSAMGLLMADVKHHFVKSKMALLDQLSAKDINEILQDMGEQAVQKLMEENFTEDKLQLEYAIDIRYAGQGYELTIPVTKFPLTEQNIFDLRLYFDQDHQQQFGHMAPDEDVEVVSYRVTGIGLVPQIEMPKFTFQGGRLEDAWIGDRQAWFNEKDVICSVYQREKLDVGLEIHGPAVIEQLDSTTVVFPQQQAKVDEWKNIIITRGEGFENY